MQIGIDCSPLNRSRYTGTEYYLDNLVWNLIHLDGQNEYILYSRKPLPPKYSKLPKNVSNKILRWIPWLWTQGRLSLEMLSAKPDLLFVPAHTIPLIHPRKTVMTVHDLAFENYPESYARFGRWHLRLTTRRATKIAGKIIAISENTKKDLIKFYGADPERIKVIKHGVDQRFKSNLDMGKISAVRDKYLPDLEGEYAFFVGRLDRRKNLPFLIRAFHKLITEFKIKANLVIAGKEGPAAESVRAAIAQHDLEEEARLPGYIADRDLPYLLAGARVLVYPSRGEGFGLPLLEAMAVSVPVIASDIPVLYETAGPAAVLVKPDDLDGWAQALLKVWTSDKMRQQMVHNGHDRVREFSWEKTARETLTVLNNL